MKVLVNPLFLAICMEAIENIFKRKINISVIYKKNCQKRNVNVQVKFIQSTYTFNF